MYLATCLNYMLLNGIERSKVNGCLGVHDASRNVIGLEMEENAKNKG